MKLREEAPRTGSRWEGRRLPLRGAPPPPLPPGLPTWSGATPQESHQTATSWHGSHSASPSKEVPSQSNGSPHRSQNRGPARGARADMKLLIKVRARLTCAPPSDRCQCPAPSLRPSTGRKGGAPGSHSVAVRAGFWEVRGRLTASGPSCRCWPLSDGWAGCANPPTARLPDLELVARHGGPRQRERGPCGADPSRPGPLIAAGAPWPTGQRTRT